MKALQKKKEKNKRKIKEERNLPDSSGDDVICIAIVEKRIRLKVSGLGGQTMVCIFL